MRQTTFGGGPGAFGGVAATAIASSAFMMVGIFTKGLVLVHPQRPRTYAGFVKTIDLGKLVHGLEANVALVNLDDGTTREYGLVPGDTACSVNAIFDEQSLRVFEAVEALGLGCGRGNEITGFRVQGAGSPTFR